MMILLDKILILRKPELSDIENLYMIKNEEESGLLLGGFSTGYSRDAIKDWIQFHNSKEDELLYVIYDLKNEKVIGHIGFYNIDYRIRKAEFAILIGDKESRGKGYGRLCTCFMIDYGFNQLNLNRIELSLLSSNKIAYSLYLKCNFIKEGVLKQAQYKNGQYVDVILMARLRNK